MYRNFFKRLFDILGALILIILTLPIMIWAYFAIKKHLGSPVIFTQSRPGKDEKIFQIYKFRSMSNATDQNGNLLSDEIRLGEFGKKLRALSIDELPQLFNILKGDMSIVGPRPALPREVKQYTVYQTQRLFITPGLTCYWQIQPNRNDISFDEWVEMDLQYIRERSFLVDWKIIFKTIIAVFTKQGR